MSKPRRVSIIVLTYNQLEYTKQCFESIRETTDDYELLVVDNASTDGTRPYLEELQQEWKQLRVVLNSTNRGYAGGCNRGVQEARYEAVCLLNNDTVALPGWLDAMRSQLRPDVGIVGARLLFPDDTLQHAGIYFHVVHVNNRPMFAPDHRFARMPADTLEANITEPVVGVTGACLLTTKRVWDQVGGMDEGYAMAIYEDVDFNLKVRDVGLRVIYEPSATLIHFQNTTIKSMAGHDDDPMQHKNHNFARLNAKWFSKLAAGLAEV